jgi:NADH-quinone oxidoreductase subunit D
MEYNYRRQTDVVKYGPIAFSVGGFCAEIVTDGEKVLYASMLFNEGRVSVDQVIDLDCISKVLQSLRQTSGCFHFFYEIAMIMTIEKWIGFVPLRRDAILRVFLCEAQRIVAHLLCVCEVIKLVGVDRFFFEALRMRNALFRILTQFRLRMQDFAAQMCAKNQPANQHQQDPHSDQIDCMEIESDFCHEVYTFALAAKELSSKAGKVISSFLFKVRTKRIGVISGELAHAFSLSGPNARASGVCYDVRNVNADSDENDIYNKVPLQIITCDGGDVYSRCELRIKEVEQSVDILRRCLELLSETFGDSETAQGRPPCFSNIFALLRPPDCASDCIPTTQTLQKAYSCWHQKNILQPKWSHVKSCYHAIESPQGELGFFLMNSKPGACRCQLNGASTNAVQVFEKICVGANFDDVQLIARSLDLQQGEV